MNQLALDKKKQNLNCTDMVTKAEQELAAFCRAVTELFGSQQAGQSAEDWLNELLAINVLPASAREWRLLTVKIAARLARRLNPAHEAALVAAECAAL